MSLNTLRRVFGICALLSMIATPILYWMHQKPQQHSAAETQSNSPIDQGTKKEVSEHDEDSLGILNPSEEEVYALTMHLISFLTSVVTAIGFMFTTFLQVKRKQNSFSAEELNLELKRLEIEEKRLDLADRLNTRP